MNENDQKIYQALENNGYLLRRELVWVLKIPRTTVYDALMRLERAGKVEGFNEKRTTRGRPRRFWRSVGA